MPLLSKTRFVAGLQCYKRLYFTCHSRDLADPVDAATQARFDTGHRVGELARGLRPAGVLIDEDHRHHAEAMLSTQTALEDSSVRALYEAAFEHERVAIRADILAKPAAGACELIEVKSSTEIKPQHLADVAIQVWVLEGCGISVSRAMLALIDNSYVYEGGDYDVDRLFVVHDVTHEIRREMPGFLAELTAMREMLAHDDPPEIAIGPHCARPYRCGFWTHCHADEPVHSIDELHGLRAELRDNLLAEGYVSIDQIPADFEGLSELQARMRDCITSGRVFFDRAIESNLRGWGRPLFFLDFETISPALPRYVGTRPYQRIPFQWSIHQLNADNSVAHFEYLHDGPDDPRPRLASRLVQALGSLGKIVHYSPYEAGVITALAEAVPGEAAALAGLTDRLIDLAPEIRSHYYHPDLHGSFSLKSVLPVLLPCEGYGDLGIADGTSASLAYEKLLESEISNEQQAQLREDLLTYCHYDTEALLKLYRRLAGAA